MDWRIIVENRPLAVFALAFVLLCAAAALSREPLAAAGRSEAMEHLSAVTVRATGHGSSMTDDPATGTDLLSAAEIIDNYIAATGGREAYAEIMNRVTRATVEIPIQGITMDMTVYSARPDKFYSIMESAALGTIERGFDGEIAWENSPMSGPQIKEGAERGDIKRDAVFDKYIKWRELCEEVVCIGIDTLQGGPAFKVVITPKEGNEQILYFDEKSSLIVRIESVVETPMGTVPFVTRLSDYRDIGGVLVPHKVMVRIMGQDRLITTESIECNVELPDGLFDLPAEIREIVEKRKE